MPAFSSNLPEPLPKPEPLHENNEMSHNPYPGKDFSKDTFFSQLIRGPKLPEERVEKKSEKPEQFSISRKELKKELEKAYDPFTNIKREKRIGIEAEIESKRSKIIDDRHDVGKYLKHLQKEKRQPSDKDWEGASRKLRFFDKFWKRLRNRNT